MELLVMRHADAVTGDGDDFKRVLSNKGRKQAEKMGDWLKTLALVPDVAATSPLPRASETADIVLRQTGCQVLARSDERLACGMSLDDAAGILHELGTSDGRMLLVGHEPDLGFLVSYMIGAEKGTVEMLKGSIACLRTVRIGRAGSQLRWLITPKLLS